MGVQKGGLAGFSVLRFDPGNHKSRWGSLKLCHNRSSKMLRGCIKAALAEVQIYRPLDPQRMGPWPWNGVMTLNGAVVLNGVMTLDGVMTLNSVVALNGTWS